MRVTLTVLRRGGRELRAESQKPLTGDVHTKRFKAGDTWVKVLAFQQSGCAPGMIELYDPKIKKCLQGQAPGRRRTIARNEAHQKGDGGCPFHAGPDGKSNNMYLVLALQISLHAVVLY